MPRDVRLGVGLRVVGNTRGEEERGVRLALGNLAAGLRFGCLYLRLIVDLP